MIDIIQDNSEYIVKFKYDPNVIDIVKKVSGRKWDPDRRVWTIPSEKLGFLINMFKGTYYEGSLNVVSDEHINQNYSLDETVSIPDIPDTSFKFISAPGTYPYNHQIDFMKWAIDRQLRGNMSGFVLGDDPGLGKSLEVINLALHNREKYKFSHCLIICCINSSKYNWESDISKHTDSKEHGYILGSRLRRDGSVRHDVGGKEKLEDLTSLKMYNKTVELPYFLILNIEALRYKVNRKYPIADRIIQLINSGDINIIAIDEIHKNASPQSSQGKQILRIKDSTKYQCMWIPLTGTPITKQPTDVFIPLRVVDGHNYRSFYTWSQRYCMYGGYGGYEVVGYRNIDELKSQLQKNMIRRRRDDVLDLPPKVRSIEYVDLSSAQCKLYESIKIDMINDKETILKSVNPQNMFLRLRQVTGNPELIDSSFDISSKSYLSQNSKLSRLLEIVDDIVSRDEKVVIYSNWVESLRTLYKFVSRRYKVCCYTGTMKSDIREKHKYAFQNDKSFHILIGTIGALGTSHTLTAATNVIFYDDPWNPSDKEQAEDRIYRIGTTHSVNIYTLVAKDTVDEHIEDILYRKEAVANYIVDNKLDFKHNPELFNILLR